MLHTKAPHSGEIGAASAAEEETPPQMQQEAAAKEWVLPAAGPGAALRRADEARGCLCLNGA